MQVIRQDRRGDHLERTRGVCLTKRHPQQVDVIHQQAPITFQQIDREEVGATRHPCASIAGHAPKVRESARGSRQRYTRV